MSLSLPTKFRQPSRIKRIGYAIDDVMDCVAEWYFRFAIPVYLLAVVVIVVAA